MKQPRTMPPEAAEALAIQALTYLAGDEERLERFLAITGVGVDQIRDAASEPGFLAGVLEYLASDEQLAAAFTAESQCGVSDIARAHHALGGEPWEREIP